MQGLSNWKIEPPLSPYHKAAFATLGSYSFSRTFCDFFSSDFFRKRQTSEVLIKTVALSQHQRNKNSKSLSIPISTLSSLTKKPHRLRETSWDQDLYLNLREVIQRVSLAAALLSNGMSLNRRVKRLAASLPPSL